MRIVIQRVASASVTVDGAVTGAIGPGLLVFLGVARGDSEADADWLAGKAAALRVFEDADGKMNVSVRDIRGGVLVVPNFTVCGDASHGRRPDFTGAARPDTAEPLFEHFKRALAGQGVERVQSGVFGADMRVSAENDGPVTLVLEGPGR